MRLGFWVLAQQRSYLLPCLCPLTAASSWIQVNLGETRKVTGIVIQGCPQNDHWVTKFKIQHSMNGLTWTDYPADGDVSKNCMKLHSDFVVYHLPDIKTVQSHTWELLDRFICLNIHDNNFLFLSFSSRFYQEQQTETLLRLSCWGRLCQLSSSASFQWSSAVRQAFGLRC